MTSPNSNGDGGVEIELTNVQQQPTPDPQVKDKQGKKKEKKEKKVKVVKEVQGFNGKKSPEENANPLSRLTFSWADSFVWHCFRNVLELHHIWNLATYDRSEYLSKKIEGEWKRQLELRGKEASYTRAALRCFGGYFIISWIFYAIYAASQFVGPELLSRMVVFVLKIRLGVPDTDPNMGYYYAVAMFGSAMIGSFCLYQSNMISARVGDWLRSIIVCDVYKKSLRLSTDARAQTSPGEIVNLMSNDAQRMVEVFLLVNNGVFAPFQIIVCVALMIRAIGWPTVIGLLLMIFMAPLNGLAAKKLTEIRRNMIKYTDARVKTTNEILQAIKVIKLYAWEDSFAKKILSRRNDEVKFLYKFSNIRAGLIFIVAAVPTLVSVVVYSTYYGYYKKLQADEIFSSLAYLNILRLPLGFLPIIIALMAQLRVSAQRVSDFLLLPEIVPLQEPSDPNKGVGVYIEGCDFDWNSTKEDGFKLRDITLECTGPTLTMVVGSVGSGKSSICQSILGEMNTTKGSLSVRGTIAYVPQQAWIINATLRDNIIFGAEFDEARYNHVLEVCALGRDIELFPQGDLVEIGERGLNLSGGQKQRVSIARAVYNNADIYILDDPLSAVDAHVGKHLFHKCFNGILKGKTVILAANQLNYLPYADKVVVMGNGTISETGTYKQILENKSEFTDQLKEYGVDEVQDHSDEGSSEGEKKKKDEDGEDKVGEEKTKPKEKVELKNKDGKLVAKEERETGSVSNKMYLKYFTAGGGFYFVIVFMFFLLDTGSRIFTDWWLSHWSNETQYSNNSSLTDTQYLYIYIGIGITSVIFAGIRNVIYFQYTVKAAHTIHNKLFAALMRAPMWFFDTTPLGRIINRFTRDQDALDNLIAPAISQYFVFFMTVIGTLIIISIITPFLLIPLGPIIIIFYLLQYFYRFTSRELQRLESISRSPIFAHFSESLNGVQSIRAYRKQESNILANQYKLDQNNKCYLTLQAMNQWLGLRLDLLGNLVIFFAAVFITKDRGTISIADIGLSLTYALSITGNLNRATLQAADTETKMNSVERIYQYINGPVEAPQVIPDCRPAEDWPSKGAITFDNLVMRYREGLDPVLKGINCEIKPREKIGIVGRTGAGKSSIVLALFRLIEASEGKILIDGVDVSKFGLKDLRRNLSIIPQDPVLFSGTLRENLDPFDECTDDELWESLENIQLAKVVKTLEGGLLCKVTENGENWSVGQRQLICLSRALLRKPKILVLDEATASVDSQTDALIQRTVREKFSNCTILTIAHRLNTIMDSDRIMVLDAGRISEFDTPFNLLQNQAGLLSWLVDETGPQNSIVLRNMASEKSLNNLNIPVVVDQNQNQNQNDNNNNDNNNNNNTNNTNNNESITTPPPPQTQEEDSTATTSTLESTPPTTSTDGSTSPSTDNNISPPDSQTPNTNDD